MGVIEKMASVVVVWDQGWANEMIALLVEAKEAVEAARAEGKEHLDASASARSACAARSAATSPPCASTTSTFSTGCAPCSTVTSGCRAAPESAKLIGMDVTGLGWAGTRTRDGEQLARFYESVLGLPLVHTEPDFWVFELPDGRHVEVFGTEYAGKEHFTTGPVVGFAVRDLPTAVEVLRTAGVELLGEPGPTWQHFRGPDGNVYELLAD